MSFTNGVSSMVSMYLEKALTLQPVRTPWRALDLARAHGLTVYDAMYLEAAIRRGLPSPRSMAT